MEKNCTVMSYEAPKVEIIEVEVEKGFAGSRDGEGENMTPGW